MRRKTAVYERLPPDACSPYLDGKPRWRSWVEGNAWTPDGRVLKMHAD